MRLASYLAAWAFDAFMDSSYLLLIVVVDRIHAQEREIKRDRGKYTQRGTERESERGISFLLDRMGIRCIYGFILLATHRRR